MVTLQPKLNLRVTQKQILTPGLVQMVSVLALNKLELRDMITTEMVENPVLEELDSAVPLLDEVSRREEERDRQAAEEIAPEPVPTEKDPFDEIDFGAYFRDYLDPGYRSRQEWEDVEKPSFENFLSRPSTLTDHLTWQLSAMHLRPEVAEAAELIIGNLEEDGYLTASDDELLGITQATAPGPQETTEAKSLAAADGKTGETAKIIIRQSEAGTVPVAAAKVVLHVASEETAAPAIAKMMVNQVDSSAAAGNGAGALAGIAGAGAETAERATPEPVIAEPMVSEEDALAALAAAPAPAAPTAKILQMPPAPPRFSRSDLSEALALLRQMDPVGVACRTLQECLLEQVRYHQHVQEDLHGDESPERELLADCTAVLGNHLKELQKKEYKEIAKATARPLEAVMAAIEYIKRLDPKPGLRYNTVQPRLIEPEVAFVKHGDEYLVLMNDDDVPQLRLNPAYRRLLNRDAAEKDVRNYVKERYKSAIQLIKNIEQRKQTILKVCHAIIRRQTDFLDFGIDRLKPMMIKEVAEEIGVHPSTVSRAVANKYAHTPQGVFELRYFFSESVNGPEGGATSLLILKRRVKKLIEEEDSAHPLTDDQITHILQAQGIQVTRRTVAKYREDMKIPSTHQRRVKD